MIHFHTRNDLLEFLEEHAPYRAICRAIAEGEAELYGYFEGSAFMPEGWVVRIKSRFGKEWLVSVHLDNYRHKYYVTIIHSVIWCYWRGGKSELFQGDHPERYQKLREKWE